MYTFTFVVLLRLLFITKFRNSEAGIVVHYVIVWDDNKGEIPQAVSLFDEGK